MSTNNRKATPKLSRTQELQKKYPGHRPIPPSTRTVVITLAATVILSLVLVFVFLKKAQAPQVVGNKYVVLETSMGTIKLELDGDKAPRTVTQFLENVVGGKYDGLTFHRVMKGFMIQGGDPQGNGMGGGSVRFEGSDVKHIPGVISMAAQQTRVDQSDMQFFIMTGASDQLDGNYTAFGHVTEGMDVLGAIAATPVAQALRGERSRLVEDVRIVKVSEILD
jgi:peptidyl-prolyl cis-trans isomerase B (cyclophilin B)